MERRIGRFSEGGRFRGVNLYYFVNSGMKKWPVCRGWPAYRWPVWEVLLYTFLLREFSSSALCTEKSEGVVFSRILWKGYFYFMTFLLPIIEEYGLILFIIYFSSYQIQFMMHFKPSANFYQIKIFISSSARHWEK